MACLRAWSAVSCAEPSNRHHALRRCAATAVCAVLGDESLRPGWFNRKAEAGHLAVPHMQALLGLFRRINDRFGEQDFVSLAHAALSYYDPGHHPDTTAIGSCWYLVESPLTEKSSQFKELMGIWDTAGLPPIAY